MDNRLLAVVFSVLMIVAILLEMLTPSMGGFTLGALALMAASVIAGFRQSPEFGYLMFAVNLALFPLSLW
jgi:hypothetical protein